MKKLAVIMMCICVAMAVLAGCSNESTKEAITNSKGGEHAIEVDGETASYENVIVEKAVTVTEMNRILPGQMLRFMHRMAEV